MGGVDKQYLVSNEAMVLISIMRKSNKWVNSGISAILGGEDEPLAQRMGLRATPQAADRKNDLIKGFAPLCNINNNRSAMEMVAPFLKIVQSPSTSGALTLRALVSIDKILTHVLDENTEDIGHVLYSIAIAATHCRFEANDHAENDAVLHQIMAVMTTVVVGPLGKFINNQGLCEVIETCLSMACHMRRGELLIRNARLTLTRLLIAAFQRISLNVKTGTELPDHLHTLKSPLREAAALESRSQTPVTDKPVGTEAASSPVDPNSMNHEHGSDLESVGTKRVFDTSSESHKGSPAPVEHAELTEPATPVSYDPYDNDGLVQIFRVMISLLEPSSKYSDKTRLMIVQLFCHVFETSGESLQSDNRFVELISTSLLKNVSQLIRSNSHVIVGETLRLFNLIIITGGDRYALHLQFVLTYLLQCLTPLTDLPRDDNIDSMFYYGVPSRPKCVKLPHSNIENAGPSGPSLPHSTKSPEIREIMVEAIVRMVHTDNFFAKLFVYYDCDIQQHNLCEDLIGFLCRNAYPDTATWSTPSVPPLCLESLLSLLATIHGDMTITAESRSNVKELLDQKSHKGVEIEATELFNEKPQKGIQYAIENCVITQDSPEAIADFLYTSQRLNGATLGEYLAKNTEVYNAFLKHFDFADQRIDEAMRELLAHFRLPGESAPIESLLDGLGEYYIDQQDDKQLIKSKDAAFVLSYAIIMLHTNLYNPQVKEKEKMSLASFKSQVKGVNDNEDFDENYLDEIYKGIAAHEMIFPSEHDNDESFERGWSNVQLALHAWTPSQVTIGNAVNIDIFNLVWKPVVSTLAFIFATATDDLVFSRVITGIQRTASIASNFQTKNAVDHIIECLGKISILSSGDLACPTKNIEVKIARANGKQHSVIVSDLSLTFGSDLKAQMALITLFRIIQDIDEHHISSSGWRIISITLTNLYLYDLIEPLNGIPRVKPCYTFEWSNSGKNVGIFSALSSYLTSTADTPAEPSEEDVDSALSAQDCIKVCDIPKVLVKVTSCASEQAIMGIEEAMPNAVDGDKYYPAIIYISTLLVKTVESNPDLKAQVLQYLTGLSTKGQSVAFSGNITNLLIQLGSIDTVDLNQEAMPYYIDSLLDINHPKTWEFLSETRLDQIPDKEKLRLFILNQENYSQESLSSIFKTLGRVVDVYPEALDVLYDAKGNFVETGDQFLEFLDAAVVPCTVPNGATREKSLDRLQSTVQAYDILEKYKIEWKSVFTRGLIPLLDLLLKPQVFKRDPKNMDATRQRGASIMCKTYLVYAMRDEEDMLSTWLKLLQVMDRLLSSRKQPSLQEGITEMIKNVILVMQMSGKGNREFWDETQNNLKDWLPELATLVHDTEENSEGNASATDEAGKDVENVN